MTNEETVPRPDPYERLADLEVRYELLRKSHQELASFATKHIADDSAGLVSYLYSTITNARRVLNPDAPNYGTREDADNLLFMVNGAVSAFVGVRKNEDSLMANLHTFQKQYADWKRYAEVQETELKSIEGKIMAFVDDCLKNCPDLPHLQFSNANEALAVLETARKQGWAAYYRLKDKAGAEREERAVSATQFPRKHRNSGQQGFVPQQNFEPQNGNSDERTRLLAAEAKVAYLESTNARLFEMVGKSMDALLLGFQRPRSA